MLRLGDRLPTVKEVGGTLAINPNTVLRAYRELDHEGLVDDRRGHVFVALAALLTTLMIWLIRRRLT